MTPEEQLAAADRAIAKCLKRMAELWDPNEVTPATQERYLKSVTGAGEDVAQKPASH